jgi:mono/diheme cytochrome c family protein
MRRLAALALLLVALGLLVAGCGGAEEATPTPTTVEGGTGEDTGEATTDEETTTEETTEETTTGGGGGEGDAEAGKAVFASAGCGGCHTLEDANSSGGIGPNLDESQPDLELVVDRVTNGQGAMPSFKGQLSEQQINDVAAYVVQATSG